MAWNPDQYYPQRPGGPYLPAVPRISHNNFDTEATIADKVKNVPQFQGLNQQQMAGYIQNEIEYARTNRLGLKTDKGDAGRNRTQDTGPD